VTLTDHGRFVATYGLLRVETPLENVDDAHITRKQRWAVTADDCVQTNWQPSWTMTQAFRPASSTTRSTPFVVFPETSSQPERPDACVTGAALESAMNAARAAKASGAGHPTPLVDFAVGAYCCRAAAARMTSATAAGCDTYTE
jgi:hypothetical protein